MDVLAAAAELSLKGVNRRRQVEVRRPLCSVQHRENVFDLLHMVSIEFASNVVLEELSQALVAKASDHRRV